jgi:hypothetical protein
MSLFHLFVGVVLILFILGVLFTYGPRYAAYGWYAFGLGAILIVCCVLHSFFGVA